MVTTAEELKVDIRDAKGRIPIWCLQIDACRVHKGMSQTAMAFTIVNGTAKPNSINAT